RAGEERSLRHLRCLLSRDVRSARRHRGGTAGRCKPREAGRYRCDRRRHGNLRTHEREPCTGTFLWQHLSGDRGRADARKDRRRGNGRRRASALPDRPRRADGPLNRADKTEGEMMTSIIERYFSLLQERLETVVKTQAEAIDRAAEICADAIAADKLVLTFGTGHGSFAAMEMFPRTGTVTGFRPIVESSMISFHRVLGDGGARQYRFIHGQEGYGKAILASHHLDPEDAM